jgi:hypothetical protein
MLIAAPDAAILICQKKTHTKSSVSDLKLFFGDGGIAKINIKETLA